MRYYFFLGFYSRMKGMEKEAEESLAAAKQIFDRCIKTEINEEWEQPISVYESFLDMYAKKLNIKKVDAVCFF